MPRDLASVRRDQHAHRKIVVLIEGLPDGYTNDTTGAITGQGLGTWIGACETAIGGSETLGTRRIRPGLIVPDSVQFAIDAKSGGLQPSPLSFQILDLDDSLAQLFATEGRTSEILGQHIPAGTTPLGTSVQTIGGAGTTNPRGRYVGIERIGPNGERRTCPAIPFPLVGYDHPVHGSAEPPAGLPPVLISDDATEHAGRMVSAWCIYADPTHPSGPGDAGAYYTLDEAFAAGDLLWVGVLRDAGQVSGNKIWSLDCHGPDKLLSKTLGSRNTSRWMRISAALTLAPEESYVAIGFSGRGSAVTDSFYDSSVFAHQITATDRFALATQLNTWINQAVNGTSTNVSFAGGTFSTMAQGPAPGSVHPDAGVTTEGVFFVRRDPEDPATPSPSQGKYGVLFVAMHERAWRNLAWEPETQHQGVGPYTDYIRAPFRWLESGSHLVFPGGGATGMNVPSSGYVLGEFTTIELGYGRDDSNAYANNGSPREWLPKHTSEVMVLDRHGGQVLRLQNEDTTSLYLEGQTTAATTAAGVIDGSPTNRARWFALRGEVVTAEDDVKTENEFEVSKAVKIHQVIAGEWIEGTNHGVVSEGDEVQPAIFAARFFEPRTFGFNNKKLAQDWSGKVSGKGAIEIAPLHAYHYAINEKPVEQADTLFAQILLSTGSCEGYDAPIDDGGGVTAGANTHPLAVDFAGDYEIADLGLGIPYQLVQHPSEIRRAFATLPGSWDGDLCRLRLAYIGPFQSLDVLDSITRPRLLCWSLHGKRFGLFRLGPISPSDADVVITEADLYGQLGDPTSVIPAQNLRATGQLDGSSLRHRWDPDEGKTQLELKTRALDAGASRRTGELVEEITDHGLIPLEWYGEGENLSGVHDWRSSWRQLWQHDAPSFFAKRHFSVQLVVGRHLGQDLMPGTSILLTNPWPVNPTGSYGIQSYTGRVISATHSLLNGSATIEALIFANQNTLHFAPIVRVSAVTGSTITFYADHLGHGNGEILDGTGLTEPEWSSIGGGTQVDLYQRVGDTWTLVESDTVVSVNLTTRTLTIAGTFSTWLRDRDHYIVLRPWANQAANSWPRSTFGVTADTDLTVGDGTTAAQPFLG